MRNAYDEFMINDILPSIKKSLMKEDRLFKKQFENSINSDFYREDIKGISTYILTERTIQYIVFRDLCKEYKIFPEDLAYGNSNERLDLSIYKNIKDYSKYAEIGVEIKQVSFTKEGTLYQKSLTNLIADFDKIKRVGNNHKYILLLGLHHEKSISVDVFNEFLLKAIDKRKFNKYRLEIINQTYFKTEGFKNNNYYLINLLKLK